MIHATCIAAFALQCGFISPTSQVCLVSHLDQESGFGGILSDGRTGVGGFELGSFASSGIRISYATSWLMGNADGITLDTGALFISRGPVTTIVGHRTRLDADATDLESILVYLMAQNRCDGDASDGINSKIGSNRWIETYDSAEVDDWLNLDADAANCSPLEFNLLSCLNDLEPAVRSLVETSGGLEKNPAGFPTSRQLWTETPTYGERGRTDFGRRDPRFTVYQDSYAEHSINGCRAATLPSSSGSIDITERHKLRINGTDSFKASFGLLGKRSQAYA